MMELGKMSYCSKNIMYNSALELHMVSAFFSLGHTTTAAKRRTFDLDQISRR